MESHLISALNEQQQEAVRTIHGPVLIIAGAGSGKTRVLTHRAAYLIRTAGVRPAEIVAVTFTNKAAEEMKDRITSLLEGDPGGIRMGTFHSLCLRMLRVEAGRLGYRNDFVVFDTADQTALMKEVIAELDLDPERYPARSLVHRISAARNRFLTTEEITAALREPVGDGLIRAYEAYRDKLKSNNAMDFDDLLLKVLELFRREPERERFYQDRTRFIMVDEYQDTNRPQYMLIRSLAASTGNLCVVGDDAQSIYRFRGADIGNILRFNKDYPRARVIKLTRNYRSTGNILRAAGDVIRCNRGRIEKELWTEKPAGELIGFLQAETDRDEASFIASRISALRGEMNADLADMAVLYRTNAQSRLIEEALLRDRLPYRIYGGLRFYDRKEIKDLLAYLRLAANPLDDISLRRIINTPPRGLGRVTVQALVETARSESIGLHDALQAAARTSPATRATRSLRSLADLLVDVRRRADEGEATSRLILHLVERLEYESFLRRTAPGDVESRMENIHQLVAAAEEREAAGEGTLQQFLDAASLVSDSESVQGDTGVNLMTIHCAKGLEFPVVFMVGMEENIFPHARSLQSEDDEEIEEERRLCYVGMTRAKERLYLSCAAERRAFGSYMLNEPSRFLGEIDALLLEDLSARSRPGWGARGWGRDRAPASSARSGRDTTLGEEDIYQATDDDDVSDGLRVGMRVYHDRFGYGRVEGIEGVGEKQKATVRFPRAGSKKLMTRYANLQRVPS
ncbi:MAG: ATP-dependent helicase [Acidobacteriota bacterium]